MSGLTRRGFAAGALALASGCSARLGGFPFDATASVPGPALGLTFAFYSVTCARLGFDGVDVLTDPFWTHLPLRRVAFGHVTSEPDQVDPYVHELGDVRVVVVGHTHYDHAMDLPAVADHLHPDAHVVGAPTTAHTFAPCDLPRPLVDLGEHIATPDTPGQWWRHPSGRVRVLPIRSGHPNQVAFVHLYTDVLATDRPTCPTRAGDYQEGLTLAYLIDWLDESGQIAQRAYVQTSSTGLPAGLCPREILDEHPVGFAMLAMDCANLAMQGEHTILDELTPSVVAFCHYEDFFRGKDQEPKEGVKVDLPRAHAFFEDHPATVLFPAWDSTMLL
jgi:hypothetical protein